MRLLLVHLSDCHFRADREVSSLLRRADALADAIAAKCMEVDACLLALSGDQANSGKPAEYTVVDEFVRAVKSRITACRSGLTLHAVAIPGNHDCDFSLNQQVRDVVLKSLDVDQLTDNSIVGACTSVQQGFFDWVKTLDPSDPHPFKDPLIHVRNIALGTESIRFVLVNSAWCSTLNEQQGSLKYPPNRLAQVRDLDGQPAVVVGLVHHPFNWLQADNARIVRESLESIADLILTGHEHVSDTYRRTGPRGEQNDYVEGGVLQDDQGEDSSLNLIVIDTAAQTQQAIQYRLIDGAYRQLSDQAVTRAFERNKRRLRGEFVLCESFERGVLDDVGVNFTHPRVETLRLRDVFVYPDARRLRRRPGEEPGQLVLSRDLLSFVMGNKRSLLLGEEQSGKTALARTLYRELRHNGVIPVLIGGAQLSKLAIANTQATLDAAISEQYQGNRSAQFWGLGLDKRALIVDDFHDCPIARSKQHELLESLAERFGTVILLASAGMQMDLLASPSDTTNALWSYQPIELLELGQVRRHQLIQKWYLAGRHDQLDEDDIERQLIHIENVITSLLVRDLLPAHPVFVLIMLQAMEYATPINMASGSFGFLYEHLITSALQRATRSSERIDTLYSYMADLASELYSKRLPSLSDSDVREWHRRHCDGKALDLSFDRMIEALTSSRLLVVRNGCVGFRYPFVYYYFLARNFADNLGTLHVREEVAKLTQRLFNEDAANVIMFLCHLTRDDYVIDRVLENADGLFANCEPCDLQSNAAFWSKLTCTDKLDLPGSSSRENRELLMESMDESDLALADDPAAPDFSDEGSLANYAAQLNAAGKNVQILGQILRSFVGSLPQARKLQLAKAAYSLGLRTIASVMNALESNQEELIADYCKWLKSAYPQWDDAKIKQAAFGSIFGVVEIMTVGMLKHVSNSVGLRDLARTFSQVLEENPSLAMKMIDVSIKLDHYNTFPESEIREVAKSIHKQVFPRSVLRALVWLHYYLYPTRDHGQKQSICALLDISVRPRLSGNPELRKT